jgi:hydroxymethylpyrimidine/phosphomethylpyrimidine kinase
MVVLAQIALTIAGSDSGGGAGIQADLKTFSARRVYGCSVITAVTAQNTTAVTALHPIPVDVITAQIEAVISDLDVKAIKIGMLGMPDVIVAVGKALQNFEGPIVVDPVMVAKSGAVLLPEEAISALREILLPRATLLTPNIPEAAQLLGMPEKFNKYTLLEQGKALLGYGSHAVLMKGGHGSANICTDWLITSGSTEKFECERIATKNTHGTGCTYSSAITANLARGESIQFAVKNAHNWLNTAIRRSDELSVGQGHGPVHHFHEIW